MGIGRIGDSSRVGVGVGVGGGGDGGESPGTQVSRS